MELAGMTAMYRNCLHLMYNCGLRLGEAVKIEVSRTG